MPLPDEISCNKLLFIALKKRYVEKQLFDTDIDTKVSRYVYLRYLYRDTAHLWR